MSWIRALGLSLALQSSLCVAGEISVLLPLSGATAKAAESIRSGLLAAYYQSLSQQKTSDNLVFYDTSAYNDITPLLEKLRNTDTKLIIGPLLKEHVAQTLSNPPLVPTLALNRVTQANGAYIWQFALAPEEEFAPLINLMQSQHIKKIRILAANDSNSERLRQGFEQAWQAQGGTLLPTYVLNQTEQDGLTQSIKQLIAESQQQKTEAFYLASPQLAAYVLPLLNFYQRNPLPIYSSSQAYDAEKSLLERQDLNGLFFCGTPWVIQPERWPSNQSLRDEFSPENSSYDRLAAFGADAWVVSQLLSSAPKSALQGRTGILVLKDGQVARTPLCAEVINGKAKAQSTTTGTTR
ncbi:penicillin-binding protein activator [Agitococcus lubricus]|uniref:Putative lipoprotein LppC n=1 Tax=Agitococcus lubricus TaxID=1077255 RepID=A0A2T5J0L4_9GAMM|nr:penicillin-binding protein activator [Agitococcus lubricus]PTQ89882.1 putative lipoprotein LppC [Agitococcus lubricus]